MKISGFTFARNASKLFYPIVESIQSILPICDEFIIAIGKGDTDDKTIGLIEQIKSPKIKIIHTDWDADNRKPGHVFAKQTNIALDNCSGDWCFYIQSDEAIHEKYLKTVKEACFLYLDNPKVEGLLFNYKHFWGDYSHYIVNHKWYPKEIRIIRNKINVSSYRDAQSFRIDNRKLNVIAINAEIFHYGWVRPPKLMQNKCKEFTSAYKGKKAAEKIYKNIPQEFNYGSLEKLNIYKKSHPKSMLDWVEKFDWKEKLQYKGKSPVLFRHEHFKYRFLTFLEQKLLGGKQLGGFKNYRLIKK